MPMGGAASDRDSWFVVFRTIGPVVLPSSCCTALAPADEKFHPLDGRDAFYDIARPFVAPIDFEKPRGATAPYGGETRSVVSWARGVGTKIETNWPVVTAN
jgi:hypothetical protein